MEGAQILVAALSLIFSLCMLVIFGFLIYWTVKFIVAVPRHLKSIAESLETIANQKGEH